MELAVCTREMRTAHKILAKKLGTIRLGDLHAKREETINTDLKDAWQRM
jgi:hypothetical protein